MTPTDMTSLRLETWSPPASLDGPNAATYRAFVDATNAGYRADTGSDLFDEDATELLVSLRDTKHWEKIGIVALLRDEPVGFASLSFSRTTTETANLDLAVHPALRDDAMEDALLAEGERIARSHGRTTLHGFHFSPPGQDGTRIPSPTGFGSVGTDDWGTRLHRRNGFSLGQVERASAFDLTGSFAEVDRMLDAATAKAGPGYRVVWWAGATPDAYAEGYARAISRMSTDIPSGELDVEVDTFTVERLRTREETHALAGATMGVTLVIHEPTGEVAAFNELKIGADRTRPSENWGTLVMPEHRGRRLGTIVKCAGLRKWRAFAPESPLVFTFNAEENRYMLDVNEAVGFRPVAFSGEWQKATR